MDRITEIEKRVAAIEKRNEKVGTDKAWETSATRKLLLITFTYLAIAVYLLAIGISDPWRNAIVPAVGFLLSTLTLPFFKSMWEKYLFRK